jgi:hypothetical protein
MDEHCTGENMTQQQQVDEVRFTSYDDLLAVTVAALLRINELLGVPVNDPVTFSDEDLSSKSEANLGITTRRLDTDRGASYQVYERGQRATCD